VCATFSTIEIVGSIRRAPLEEPSDMPYGDRRGMVEDRWGNVWQIATFKQAD